MPKRKMMKTGCFFRDSRLLTSDSKPAWNSASIDIFESQFGPFYINFITKIHQKVHPKITNPPKPNQPSFYPHISSFLNHSKGLFSLLADVSIDLDPCWTIRINFSSLSTFRKKIARMEKKSAVTSRNEQNQK